MIEIVLAIAILAFGFASILGLFPVALKAVRNSQVEGIAADAANDLYGYYKSYANVPNSLVPGEFLYKTLFDYSGTGTLVDWYEGEDNDDELKDFRDNFAVGGDMGNGQKFYEALQTELKNATPDLSSLGFIEVIGLFQPSINSYFYLVKGSEDLKKIDFTAQVLVWRTQMEEVYNVGESVTKVDYDRAVILNVEISWPINVPYPDREKRYYQFSITNPKKL